MPYGEKCIMARDETLSSTITTTIVTFPGRDMMWVIMVMITFRIEIAIRCGASAHVPRA
jgi:hypothetical protein